MFAVNLSQAQVTPSSKSISTVMNALVYDVIHYIAEDFVNLFFVAVYIIITCNVIRTDRDTDTKRSNQIYKIFSLYLCSRKEYFFFYIYSFHFFSTEREGFHFCKKPMTLRSKATTKCDDSIAALAHDLFVKVVNMDEETFEGRTISTVDYSPAGEGLPNCYRKVGIFKFVKVNEEPVFFDQSAVVGKGVIVGDIIMFLPHSFLIENPR